MIEITNYRQGAILNHNHGRETEESLLVKIEGLSDMGCPVKINDVPAEMDGRRFTAEIKLTEKINVIKASSLTPYGYFSQELTLVWDKKSFRRCNFYIDDHIFVFTDLAKERPKNAFNHFYLSGLKKINEKHGTKFTLNAFYHNAHHEFLLKDMPDIWKQEFIDNSDWLKLSFHSYSEFPDRPYIEASAEEFGHDWDLVQSEINRFAGEGSFIPPVVIHWANIHPAVAQEMIRRGTRWQTPPAESLRSGDWVMKGDKSIKNYLMSGKCTPKQEFNVPYNNARTFTVPKSSLKSPGGFEKLKGLPPVNQRKYLP